MPVATITTVTATRISRISGQDFTDITITSDVPFVEYQVRLVSSTNDSRAQGTLIESGVVAPRTLHVITITDDELIDIGGGAEGPNILKAFVKDENGEWSSAVTLYPSGSLFPSASLFPTA